jgi:hypothetical protein
MNRRRFIFSAATAAAGLASSKPFAMSPLATEPRSLHSGILKSAILAASSHNTQPWKFHVEEKSISVLPDFSRRCPSVDPDDHHLFVSLGCATENLIQSALGHGLMAEALIDPESRGRIDLQLTSTKAVQSALFRAIPKRQCSRTEYDGQPLSVTELSTLAKAGSGDGVHCHLITAEKSLERILEFVIQGNTAQMGDAAFVAELKTWIRFNRLQAQQSGDGLYSATAGSPSLPTWLGKLIFSTVFTAGNENEKYSKQIRSSAGIAVFTSEKNDMKHWIEAGRCYERFALQATVMDVRNAMINQPVEVTAIRPAFANHLGIGNLRPDLVVRFGRGPRAPDSMRRNLSAVLI